MCIYIYHHLGVAMSFVRSGLRRSRNYLPGPDLTHLVVELSKPNPEGPTLTIT